MLKAADALFDAGYEVRVISTRTSGWASEADAAIGASGRWQWQTVNYDRTASLAAWLVSGSRHKAARVIANAVPAVPRSLVAAAFGRVHRELVNAIIAEPADLIYGGTAGAIAAVAEAGRRKRTAFAVDFEDFHCAEHASPQGDLSNELARVVMRDASDGAAFVTAGSEAIAVACHDELGIPALPIDNVFPLPQIDPSSRSCAERQDEFAAYWFSQTISGDRGIEDVIRAIGLTERQASLTLRGRPAVGYAEALRYFAAREAPRVRIVIKPPIAPEAMVDACAAFDIGVSAEQTQIRNRQLSLANKALTYPLAGLPVALTDTAGHRPLVRDLGAGALVFAPGDPEALAAQLLTLMTDTSRLAEARAASWRAAQTRWHWEHERERGALLSAVRTALS
jgi:glycosyltransferase involved in cell wall biosynthesis